MFGCRVWEERLITKVERRFVCMGCSVSKKKKNAIRPPGYEDPDLLASVTPCKFLVWNRNSIIISNVTKKTCFSRLRRNSNFVLHLTLGWTTVTVAEVEALYELFKKLSSSIIDDGLIHKVFLLSFFVTQREDPTFLLRSFVFVYALEFIMRCCRKNFSWLYLEIGTARTFSLIGYVYILTA